MAYKIKKKPYYIPEPYGLPFELTEKGKFRELKAKDNFAVENKKEETIGEYIVKLSKSETTSEEDDKKFQIILRSLGFDNAVVTYGIVYLDGHGTIENPPRSIQQVAGSISKAFTEKKDKEIN